MKRLLLLFTILVASPSWSASAEDAFERSVELQVLDRYIGDWETVISIRGTEEKATSTESRKWSREGKFVIFENFDLPAKREAHFLVTYDPKARLYRACFINEEYTVPLLGKWDETAETMTWRSADVEFKHHSVHRFIDKDHVEWTMTVTSPQGEIILELSAKQSRQSK